MGLAPVLSGYLWTGTCRELDSFCERMLFFRDQYTYLTLMLFSGAGCEVHGKGNNLLFFLQLFFL